MDVRQRRVDAAVRIILLIVTVLLVVPTPIESRRSVDRRLYWIYLTEENAARRTGVEPAMSPRAEARLAKVGRRAGDDLRDYPIDPTTLAPLTERGIEIRHLSRWLRAASAWLTVDLVEQLRVDPRVKQLRPVGHYVRDRVDLPRAESIEQRRAPTPNLAPIDVDPATLGGSDYGQAWEQLEMLGVPELHSRGYSGAGIWIAVFDTGFLKDHESLSGLDVVAERDYVFGDENVQYDPSDPFDVARSNDHGTYTWSAIGGFAPERHLGAAYRASFVLAKTEDVRQEIHLEEDNYRAALEWADSLGVDIVSSSLGYRYGFDDGGDYVIQELDGETLEITKATAEAAERGILIVTAMGNDGPADSTLNAPADGKRVLSIGAVDFWGGVMPWSSRGPTGDGRTKPDLLALGYQTSCAIPVDLNAYGRVNGTSLATPLISSLSALLLEARPDWTPDSLITALRSSGHRADSPDNTSGWGIPDGLVALRIEADRLRLIGYDWTEVGGGNGIVEWGETGDVRVRLRNEGTTSSLPGSLEVVGLDERITPMESRIVPIDGLAVGDSLQSESLGRWTIDDGETVGQLTFFVRYSQGETEVDRKVYMSIPENPPPVLLGSVYPNPVRSGPVRIRASRTAQTDPRVLIYGIDGRWLREIAIEEGDPNEQGVVWDLRDAEGRDVATGIYFARQPGGKAYRICVVR